MLLSNILVFTHVPSAVERHVWAGSDLGGLRGGHRSHSLEFKTPRKSRRFPSSCVPITQSTSQSSVLEGAHPRSCSFHFRHQNRTLSNGTCMVRSLMLDDGVTKAFLLQCIRLILSQLALNNFWIVNLIKFNIKIRPHNAGMKCARIWR